MCLKQCPSFSHGMQHGAGKTAFLPHIGGKDAAAMKRVLAGLPNNAIPVPQATSTDLVYLQAVQMYVHKRCRTCASGSVLPEITALHASTKPFVDRLSYQFFKKTCAKTGKKLMVASSLLLSKELYGAGGMPTLSERGRNYIPM